MAAAAERLPERNLLFEAQAKQFLKDTHRPEDLKGVVWTPPPKGAVPIKVADIYLRRDKRRDREMAPCPICSPNSPQYLYGAFTWWQDEGVYRCIGNDCIKRLCGAEAAEKVHSDFDYKKKLDEDYDYAFANINIAPAVRDYFSALMPATAHAEQLRSMLAKSKVRSVLLQLSKQNDGVLIAWQVRQVEQFDRATNSMVERPVRFPIRYGRLTGQAAFRSEFNLRTKITGVMNNISHFCVPDAQQRVLDSYGDRAILLSFRRAMADVLKWQRKALEDIRDVLAFFDADNFERINKYGEDHRTHECLFARVRGGFFKIGPTLSEAVSICPDFTILDGLPAWPMAE